jgi:hypothetical protein
VMSHEHTLQLSYALRSSDCRNNGLILSLLDSSLKRLRALHNACRFIRTFLRIFPPYTVASDRLMCIKIEVRLNVGIDLRYHSLVHHAVPIRRNRWY